MLESHLLIGEVLKPQGVRGEIKVKPVTFDISRFEGLESVFLKDGDAYREVGCRVSRIDSDAVYLTLDGVRDRDQAEKLRGAGLYVDRAHAVSLPEDTEFIVDLIGCVAADDEGRTVGTLTEVLQSGAADVYVFRGPEGQVLAPALKSLVLQVDTEKKTMLLSAARLKEVAVFEE
ncbi:MAG: 16S rRNA processing protein RimM [Clostridia bacterium]|nr:16S rRNA processing protein RimM [Clostridia bacterium]